MNSFSASGLFRRHFSLKLTPLPAPSRATSFPCLTRDFIHDRLYAPSDGYFNKESNQVGVLKAPIPFAELRGYADYSAFIEENYPENAWVTPSELFKPYYGYAIANYMM